LRLGADYSDDEYIEAVVAAREAGVGAAYANKILATGGTLVRGVEHDSGDATVRAAEECLRSRGIDPRKADYRQYVAALIEVSP
jgi:hypothetical protein